MYLLLFWGLGVLGLCGWLVGWLVRRGVDGGREGEGGRRMYL